MYSDIHEDVERYLFAAIRWGCIAGGGDGDVQVISTRYKELADKFERFETGQPDSYFTTREDKEDHVIFYPKAPFNQEEYIVFSKIRRSGGEDLLVEVP